MLDEFYRVAFRKKLYRGIDDLQADLDAWLKEYNEMRTHQGRWCFGKTPMQTFSDTLPLGEGEIAAASVNPDTIDRSDTPTRRSPNVRSSSYFYTAWFL